MTKDRIEELTEEFLGHAQDHGLLSEAELYRSHVIDRLVDRFLAWPLPKSVCSDACASQPDYPHRSGTNLLTAGEARQMFEYVLRPPTNESSGNSK